MKNKAFLILMEQLVMLLVFALAAALCLQIFVKANEFSEEIDRREQGAFLAQTAAELLKSGISPETMEVPKGYKLTVLPQKAHISGLAAVEIQISYENNPIFSLETGWQEVAE